MTSDAPHVRSVVAFVSLRSIGLLAHEFIYELKSHVIGCWKGLMASVFDSKISPMLSGRALSSVFYLEPCARIVYFILTWDINGNNLTYIRSNGTCSYSLCSVHLEHLPILHLNRQEDHDQRR